MEKENMNAQQIDDYLNRRSGILGISGLSSDFRDLEVPLTAVMNAVSLL